MSCSPISNLSGERQELWKRVNDLWSLASQRNAEKILSSLHPQYVGWDMNSPSPHNREAAIQSVVADAPVVTDYELTPLSIEIYDHIVGVVHYAYTASLGPTVRITGKWSEVYLKQNAQWVMISVSGKPDPPAKGRAEENCFAASP